MIIHFTSSSKNILQRMSVLKDLINCIEHEGHILSREWLNEATTATASQKSDINRWRKISTETIQALKRSDLVIIEATIDSFSMGLQASLAMQLKKPLLILRSSTNTKSENYINVYDINKPVEQSLIAADTTSISNIEIYTNIGEAKTFIKTFINNNDLQKADMRFNMFLDRESYNYLESVSQQTGKTKAKIVRDILKEKSREPV